VLTIQCQLKAQRPVPGPPQGRGSELKLTQMFACCTGSIPAKRCCCLDTKVLFGGVVFVRLLRGEDVEGSGFIDRLGAALYAQFAVDSAVVSFDGVQGQEESLANLTVRESLGNEL
jgi:hypothetical protein